MILKNNLYKILSYSGETRNFELSLNAENDIYKAHFPERPITPGVCIIQIAKELMEEMTHCRLMITAVKNVKFLSVISPTEVQNVNYTFGKFIADGDNYTAQLQVSHNGVAYAKISLTCAQI